MQDSDAPSDTSAAELGATQDELLDYEPTQQDIHSVNYAELRYMGSLLQPPTEAIIKIPLPTSTNTDTLVLFGRQSNSDQKHDVFVKLVDISRSKQSASGKHSLLRFSLDPANMLTASLRDLHTYKTRHTAIIDVSGRTTVLDHATSELLSDGCILHFCPRVRRTSSYIMSFCGSGGRVFRRLAEIVQKQIISSLIT